MLRESPISSRKKKINGDGNSKNRHTCFFVKKCSLFFRTCDVRPIGENRCLARRWDFVGVCRVKDAARDQQLSGTTRLHVVDKRAATRISRCLFDSAVSLGHEFRSVRKRDLTRPVCDVYTLVLHTDTRVVSLNNYFVRTIRRTHTHVYAMGTTADETDLFLRHLMWRFTH